MSRRSSRFSHSQLGTKNSSFHTDTKTTVLDMLNRATIRASEHAMQIAAYVRVSAAGSVSRQSVLTNERRKLLFEQSVSGFPEDLCRDGL